MFIIVFLKYVMSIGRNKCIIDKVKVKEPLDLRNFRNIQRVDEAVAAAGLESGGAPGQVVFEVSQGVKTRIGALCPDCTSKYLLPIWLGVQSVNEALRKTLATCDDVGEAEIAVLGGAASKNYEDALNQLDGRRKELRNNSSGKHFARLSRLIAHVLGDEAEFFGPSKAAPGLSVVK